LDEVALVVEVLDRAMHGEEGDHGLVAEYLERMHIAGRLPYIRAGLGHPVVLEVAPGALKDVALDRSEMPVTRDVATAFNTDQVDPPSRAGREMQRLERKTLTVGHPRYVFLGEMQVGKVESWEGLA